MQYPVDYPPFRYNVVVVIYHGDGSVGVTHGGTEIGQGINTKVICATQSNGFQQHTWLMKKIILLDCSASDVIAYYYYICDLIPKKIRNLCFS